MNARFLLRTKHERTATASATCRDGARGAGREAGEAAGLLPDADFRRPVGSRAIPAAQPSSVHGRLRRRARRADRGILTRASSSVQAGDG